jgi:hypothetical protein
MKRTTSLGKGNKYDFTRDHKDKNPQFYNSRSDFDLKNPHSPMYSFGESRDKYAKVYYETTKMFDKDVPGPGKYEHIYKPFGGEAPKFSIKGKPSEKGLVAKSTMPGPGQYQIKIQINKEGKLPVSNIRNTTTVNFGANKAKRFNYEGKKNI